MPLALDSEKFGFVSNIYVLRLGYRFQPESTGFIFRASLNPTVIVFIPSIMGGIGLGYVF